jgi:hypothetical protein
MNIAVIIAIFIVLLYGILVHFYPFYIAKDPQFKHIKKYWLWYAYFGMAVIFIIIAFAMKIKGHI